MLLIEVLCRKIKSFVFEGETKGIFAIEHPNKVPWLTA